ncbi:hypothetical protein F9874_06065 [Glaesserella parasuis]|uniref:hypothetical protein n=1 Tax=Glaesserella parasuis TaxID=738 RepID=UPI000165B6A3|nr:hypothetical protein [Glaesserella parasuis]AIK17113.1 hypothetical protein JL26_04560 [Glaesserella parasuis]ATW45638.1 hypothetical protein A2U21_06705 [Glaesserella parasuis str. Nagasaki]AWY45727.1 hypothetical protein B4U42_07040 [Glaesserella parasuis 29755]EQA04049.1 putative membrane protein [Glaesserella parasuis str. Nagasaki]EQA96164.1 putative membrane protein [Glaesserella parasuis 29755]
MLTLQIIGGILGAVLIGYLLFLFIRKVFRIYWTKFKFDIFSKKIFIIEAIIGVLFTSGIIISEVSIDKWNGYTLCLLSSLIFIGLLTYIYRKTDFNHTLLSIPIILIILPFLSIIALFVISEWVLEKFGIDIDEYIAIKPY